MKFLYSFIFILFSLSGLLAQDFHGIATYKSHRKVDLKMDDSMSDEMQEQIQAQLRKQFQQEYTLKFNGHESVYKKEEKLEAPNPIQSGIQIKINEGSDVMYKNIKENRYVNQTEIFGKIFLIKDSLQNLPWQLIGETKNIGEYTCFKAEFEDEYTTQTLTDKGEMETETKPRTTTVWYTPQIPINNGPMHFNGLPGLILEVNEGDLTLVCTKVILNPKNEVIIEEPDKGKSVSQLEFDEIQEKKSKEMMEQFQVRRGREGDHGERVIIRMGG